MRAASILGLVIGWVLTCFAFIQYVEIDSRESSIYRTLTVSITQHDPNFEHQFFDPIMQSFQTPWIILGCAGLGLAVISALVLTIGSRQKRQ